MTPTAKLIQDQLRAWHGVSISDARAEALSKIAATMRRTVADAVGRIAIDDRPADFDLRLTSIKSERMG